MSGDALYVQTDGVRSYAQIHDEIAAGLSQLLGTAAPEAAGVQTTHGAIAAQVSAALAGALGVRQGTLQTTANSGNTISDLLEKAAQRYEQGDQKGAETLRAAAEAMASGANTPGGSAAPQAPGSPDQPDGAAPGDAAGTGRPPELLPVEGAERAQTAPSSD